ncbi:hypothetical protein SDC9_196512 [bioreactor metagenome]|uniref:Uncharacterized protein n=1 Tax=bioreactor metagenome TaxID=1076179 RepID=A0A645ICP3_9ZZZZ
MRGHSSEEMNHLTRLCLIPPAHVIHLDAQILQSQLDPADLAAHFVRMQHCGFRMIKQDLHCLAAALGLSRPVNWGEK